MLCWPSIFRTTADVIPVDLNKACGVKQDKLCVKTIVYKSKFCANYKLSAPLDLDIENIIILLICDFHVPHNLTCPPHKILRKYCFQFILEQTIAPEEILWGETNCIMKNVKVADSRSMDSRLLIT